MVAGVVGREELMSICYTHFLHEGFSQTQPLQLICSEGDPVSGIVAREREREREYIEYIQRQE